MTGLYALSSPTQDEFLFFPLIVLAMTSFSIHHTVIRYIILNAIVATGYLINEIFIFLALPLLICCCFLDKQKSSHILSLPLTAMLSLAAIFIISVKPEPATTNYILSLQKMGFDTTGDLTHPVRFMRMGLVKSVQFSAGHFKLSYTFLYLFLYSLNILFVYRLFKTHLNIFKEVFTSEVLSAILLIHIGIVPLLFFGMDYGRWFSFAFIISLVLIMHRMKKMPVAISLNKNSPANTWILFSLFFLFIHIPQLAAFNIYRPMDYANEFLTFLYPF
jgi:hypothetical protein